MSLERCYHYDDLSQVPWDLQKFVTVARAYS